MGNCLHNNSSLHWGGDYWGSPASDRILTTNTRQEMQEKTMIINTNIQEEEESTSSSTSTNIDLTSYNCSKRAPSSGTDSSIKEVKIKISKKQLQVLLSKIDMKELSVQQVLAQLIKASDQFHESSNQQSWRPNLHSIPE